ncbi:hypothetical protein [Aquimarina brevivitae]|uniref:Uncharacterized protein n=1 Tax=Aquimarina brevivitae TaxID=323412 RepID=A0A4Q7P3W0_9FLAO|nr:hypothetical protein [Aquimarina brevivitae]RZS93372.1 hypothetical protein EV197_1950 [Aquimarina brevivitae]
MNSLKYIFYTVKEESPILYTIVWIHFILALGCALGVLLDDRMLMGINVWIKPFKFTISGGIYVLTVGFLITLYPFSVKKKNILRNWVSWTMLFEILIIVVQGARGVQSHYNQSNALDGILFGLMGLLVGINVLIMIFFAIETLRLKLHTKKSVQLGILMGWIILIFGSWIGGQMIAQMAHNVGVADGGEGLPLLNWSTLGGDLRVAHFFGLHAIQIIPLFAFAISRNEKRPQITQLIAVLLFGLSYASWIGYTFYQAKKGIPLLTI